MNSLHTGILCAKFGWNWPSGSGEEHFQKLSINFYYFPIISTLGRALPFNWTDWIPYTQEYLVPSLVEIDPVVLEKKMKMWNFTDGRTDRQKDDGWQVLRWARNGCIIFLVLPIFNERYMSNKYILQLIHFFTKAGHVIWRSRGAS